MATALGHSIATQGDTLDELHAMAARLGNRVIGVCDSPIGLVRRACAAAACT